MRDHSQVDRPACPPGGLHLDKGSALAVIAVLGRLATLDHHVAVAAARPVLRAPPPRHGLGRQQAGLGSLAQQQQRLAVDVQLDRFEPAVDANLHGRAGDVRDRFEGDDEGIAAGVGGARICLRHRPYFR